MRQFKLSGTHWGVAQPKFEPRHPKPGLRLPSAMCSVGIERCAREPWLRCFHALPRAHKAPDKCFTATKGAVLGPAHSGDVSVYARSCSSGWHRFCVLLHLGPILTLSAVYIGFLGYKRKRNLAHVCLIFCIYHLANLH